MTRILTALAVLAVLWTFVAVAPVWALAILVAAVAAVASWECYRLLDALGTRPFRWVGCAAAVALCASFLTGAPRGPALPLLAATILTLLAAMWLRPDPRAMLESSLSTFFPILFVGLAMAHAVGIRTLDGGDGRDLLLFLMVCLAFADTLAFYVGRSLGRRRLAPRLSPKKTWEGAAAGVGGSALAGLLAHLWFYQRLPLGHALAMGALLGCAGILGDLAESMVKRAAGAKDASGILPGHGGVLDRLDSMLFAAPVLYYYYALFLGRST